MRKQFDKNESREPSPEIIFGVNPVLEALRAGRRSIEKIFIVEGAHDNRLRHIHELARAQSIVLRRVSRDELRRLTGDGSSSAHVVNHQGIVAVVAAAKYTVAGDLLNRLEAKINTDDKPLTLVLDGVEDPRNLGAIIRTAECAGAHGIFIPERRAVGLTSTVAKAAAGALEYVPVARVTNIADLIEDLKRRNIWTIATSGEARVAYTDFDWSVPCAIVLGAEGEGVRRLVQERCDQVVGLPLRGQIESLNVSVAAGIVLYEAMRQRTIKNPDAYNLTAFKTKGKL